ncbi:MAG: tRNA guanosine(34) transglycosylase Tgt [Chloroflexi bacterium]|nr:tRNA guanosine(34) transglycosylase Tgt [Chloroflexota bacterium]
MPATHFRIHHRDPHSHARLALLETPHGPVQTPAFIPVGTQASVKSLAPDEVLALGGEIVLCNTYHLYLRPGADLIATFGGLHGFMAWDRPIITDSGGFQVFSLGFGIEHGVGKIAAMFPGESQPKPSPGGRLTRIDEEGVTFISHIDGSRHVLTPEKSVAVQQQLGADVILAFDECTSPLSSYEYTREAMHRTHRWALRSLQAARGSTSPRQGLFGIVQGGEYRDLREESARFIGGLPFEGLAIGGSLGKSKCDMHRVLDWTVPLLPDERPRHLLGIGDPDDFFECIPRGIDLFDCVAPTRLARHGGLYTPDGRLNIRNAAYRLDTRPIQDGCDCFTCQRFTRGYLRHLFVAEELLAYRLATLHNLRFIVRLVEQIRAALRQGTFAAFRYAFLHRYVAARKGA